jgi:hypothetical protein
MSGANGIVMYPVLSGLKLGERVVTSGSFLVDAETRLNPAAGSIYFGGSGGAHTNQSSVKTVRPSTPEDPEAKIQASLASMPADDRKLAQAQKFCPVLPDSRLGSMGTPVKLMVQGKPVFICCSGCTKKALANPQATLASVERLKQGATGDPTSVQGGTMPHPEETAEITAALEELSPDDRSLARQQRFCAVLNDSRLGSMGAPVKVMIEGQPVFLCCEGCQETALANPKETIATVAKLKNANRVQGVK